MNEDEQKNKKVTFGIRFISSVTTDVKICAKSRVSGVRCSWRTLEKKCSLTSVVKAFIANFFLSSENS